MRPALPNGISIRFRDELKRSGESEAGRRIWIVNQVMCLKPCVIGSSSPDWPVRTAVTIRSIRLLPAVRVKVLRKVLTARSVQSF